MKKEIKKLLGWLKTRKSSALFAPLIVAMIGCAMPDAQAAVQATQFDPPLKMNAWSEVTDNDLFNILAADFNADGVPDFRLAQGLGGIEAYFNFPTRYARRGPQFIPGVSQSSLGIVIDGGPVAAVPLNSLIGTNIVSPGTNTFAWSPGFTNGYDLTQPFGDHEATVISVNLAIPLQPGPVINFSTNGTLTTNIVYGGPLTIGDVVNREAVMAVEFYKNGEPHYGYIHFDFRTGAGGIVGGGVIYGWAYETEPNVAIKARPLSTSKTRVRQPKPPPTEIFPGRNPPITAQPQ